MARVTNISEGPRGAYLNGDLVMAERGATIEADDFNEEWFAAADASEDVSAEDVSAGEGGDSVAVGDINSAIALLDAANDEHWTNAGLPAVDAVGAILGRTVTRAEINEAAPEFMRPEAA